MKAKLWKALIKNHNGWIEDAMIRFPCYFNRCNFENEYNRILCKAREDADYATQMGIDKRNGL